jgi:hypothetical protein
MPFVSRVEYDPGFELGRNVVNLYPFSDSIELEVFEESGLETEVGLY